MRKHQAIILDVEIDTERGAIMTAATRMVQITEDQLREMIDSAVERKLMELLGDPDEGFSLRKAVRERLLQQQKSVKAGARGQALEKVIYSLGAIANGIA